jgi:hypothetical protein
MTDYLDPGDLPRPHVHELFERATIFLRLQDGASDPDLLDPDDAEFAHARWRGASRPGSWSCASRRSRCGRILPCPPTTGRRTTPASCRAVRPAAARDRRRERHPQLSARLGHAAVGDRPPPSLRTTEPGAAPRQATTP